jgi:glycosyltransferase involved in cell wall biosynthesis
MKSSLKILSVVEATTVNAVGKLVLDFYVTARELAASCAEFPAIEGPVVTFDRASPAQPNEFILAAKNAGVEIDIIPERRRFDLNVLPALKCVAADRGPDVIVTNSVKSHFLLWRTRLWQKYPWVAFHHGYTATDSKMRLYNRLDRWSLPKADRVVTVCQAFANELSRLTRIPEEQIFVQHNAIRPQAKPSEADVGELKARLGVADNERVILSVGRLSKEKAHADLIDAFKLVCAQHPELKCKLVIVGDGPERARLAARAQAPLSNQQIIFAGQVSNAQPFYHLADVFALPSHSEGSPNVLLEAMAAEVPIIATAVGGVPEIVQHEASALLVSPQTPAAMAQAIHQILNDNRLAQRLVANAANLLTSKHSADQYARSLLRLYHEVIEARSSPDA